MQAKKIIVIGLFFSFLFSGVIFSQVSISDKDNQTAHSSAVLDLISEDKGFLLPRMVTSDRDNISDPSESLLIFNLATKCIEIYLEESWNEVWCLPGYEPGLCDGFNFQNCGDNFCDPRDGNVYKTVQMGDQCWFRENLRYLPEVHNNSEFEAKGINSEPAFGVQGYDGSDVSEAKDLENYAVYGVMYSWWAAMDGETEPGSQGICPDGWILPSDIDWMYLEGFVDSTYDYPEDEEEWLSPLHRGDDVGSQLAHGYDLWDPGDLREHPAFEANDDFLAYPGGYRETDGDFRIFGLNGHWWTSNSRDDDYSYGRYIRYNITQSTRNAHQKERGFYVRCLKEDN